MTITSLPERYAVIVNGVRNAMDAPDARKAAMKMLHLAVLRSSITISQIATKQVVSNVLREACGAATRDQSHRTYEIRLLDGVRLLLFSNNRQDEASLFQVYSDILTVASDIMTAETLEQIHARLDWVLKTVETLEARP